MKDMKTVVVRLLSKEERLEILRRKRLDLINELKNVKLLYFCVFFILPIIFLIHYKLKNNKIIIEINKINKKIIEIGGFEPKYQKIWNVKKSWKF